LAIGLASRQSSFVRTHSAIDRQGERTVMVRECPEPDVRTIVRQERWRRFKTATTMISVIAPPSAYGGNPMTQDTALRRHPRGGIYFDDFVVGHLYEHPLRRTVTQMDNMLFSNMTLNPQPLHIDRHFCEQETEWGQPLMNSLFTLGLMIGIMVNDLSIGTTIANLGMTEVKFPHPLFEGDTVHCNTEVISKRESTSRPGAGIVEFHHRAYNQDNKLVAECRRQVFMRMRPR
jgi:acyl dehydratase